MNKLRQKPWKYAIILGIILLMGFAVNVSADVPDQIEAETVFQQLFDCSQTWRLRYDDEVLY